MPIGWRPTHPGDPTPDWGPFGRTGCIVFVAVVIAILVIAALSGATFAATVLLIPVAFDT